jgi:hypothetical protein|tara:strand:- start:272 stop:910 length:639 start_codon:yes stop_codon:yes gene_type:complete
MTELILRNKDILADLEKVRNAVLPNIHLLKLGIQQLSKDFDEKFMGEEYLKKHMSDPTHVGHPVEYYGHPVNDNTDFKEICQFVKGDFIANLGANSDAVFTYYPKGGGVGWHTNQNNSGYQFIFSWSEKGDGYFQYYDKKKEEIVKIPDVAGWQVRGYHFGKEEEDHCWHSAYTNVPRITVCALFRWWEKPEMKEQVLAMKDQLIEDIESEI